MSASCFLARFAETPCEGRLVRCHLLPRSLMRREFPEGALWLVGRAEAISLRVWRRDHLEAVVTIPVERRVGIGDLEADPRGWVWGCGGPCGDSGHHGQMDRARKLRIPRVEVPIMLEEFAGELGLLHWVDREYGRFA